MKLAAALICANVHNDVKPMKMFHRLYIANDWAVQRKYTNDEETMKIFHRLDIAEDESHRR